MHVGGLTLLEGPPPPLEEFLAQIRQRLHLVPRYRHKLAHTHTALDSGRPVWVDDPSFNLEYHVRHTALPAPGDWEQLCGLTARIFSQQLDRSKPLWEMWLIEGLEEDRFALISKTHHSLIDGIAGIDLATVLFDLSPDPPPVRHSGARGSRTASRARSSCWRPGCDGALRAGRRAGGGAVDALAHPDRALRRGARGRGGRRGDRLGRAQPGAGDAAERGHRAAPALRRGGLARWRTSRSSRTRSAAPSTTSCWRSSPARCATF